MTGPHKEGDEVGRYKILRYINEGGMQFVYAAYDSVLDRVVALKTPKNTSALKRFKRSATMSAKVNHPNVAKTLDYLDTEDRPYLIEELIEGHDFKSSFLRHMKVLDPYLAARIFHHLSKGLSAAHHVNVIHRDLKPTNIMVSDDPHFSVIKITDFGIAKLAIDELTEAAEGGEDSITASQTAMGALPYMAPESIETPKAVGLPADVWSIGAMMYELLTGEKPFGIGLNAVNKIVKADPPVFPDFIESSTQFSPLAIELKEIILNCLQKNPNSRPTADGLVEQCSHLCYPIADRYVGQVKLIKYQSWGFIDSDGEDVFFHLDSVYGQRPNVGDSVVYSKFVGGGAWRAHPVIRINPKSDPR